MIKNIDLLVICPGASNKLYGPLSRQYSAIEPNVWALMLANSALRNGFNVEVIDVEAELFTYEQVAELAYLFNPRLILFVATGQNPNASSAAMTGVIDNANVLRDYQVVNKIAVVGPHVNALPLETLEKHDCIDIVFTNEGVYALNNVLKSDLKDTSLRNIKGIGYRDSEGHCHINEAERIVPQDRLAEDLPGMAFDFITDWNRYRTSTWHTNFNDEATDKFASLYTSLGCPYKCHFCMINIINRTDNNLNLASNHFNVFRHWEPSHIINWLDYLANKGVRNIKFADELFVYKPKHCLELCKLIIERGYDFNIWAYTRVNTVKEEYLETFKRAGINWLAIGVESGSQSIRTEITKGFFKDENIRDVIARVRSYDINVGANYIFGLGHDTYETMQETLDLAIELNTENANFYTAAALPGSPLYFTAKEQGWKLPEKYSEYGFLSYDCLPTPTYSLGAAEVLKFRDNAFHKYFEGERFLTMVGKKFGQDAVDNIRNLTKIRLKRKILGD